MFSAMISAFIVYYRSEVLDNIQLVVKFLVSCEGNGACTTGFSSLASSD